MTKNFDAAYQYWLNILKRYEERVKLLSEKLEVDKNEITFEEILQMAYDKNPSNFYGPYPDHKRGDLGKLQIKDLLFANFLKEEYEGEPDERVIYHSVWNEYNEYSNAIKSLQDSLRSHLLRGLAPNIFRYIDHSFIKAFKYGCSTA